MKRNENGGNHRNFRSYLYKRDFLFISLYVIMKTKRRIIYEPITIQIYT